MSNSKQVDSCRACGNHHLVEILQLGNQPFSGFFPSGKDSAVPSGDLSLVKCVPSPAIDACGLVQLKHNFDLDELYGSNYGYRSGLNSSMVAHLNSLREKATSLAQPKAGDLVVDIGANDGTLLKGYPSSLSRYGIDPTIAKFGKYYPEDIHKYPTFFNEESRARIFENRTAKIITSISMFYDLPKPTEFVRSIAKLLSPDGIWLFEQSYLVSMIENMAFDTVCHEHLEYYSLFTIDWLLKKAGLKIIHAELTPTNGGSVLLMAAHENSKYPASLTASEMIETEKNLGYTGLEIFRKFANDVQLRIQDLKKKVADLKTSGHRVLGLGASTKGNVLLNACRFTEKDIPYVLEVNDDKFGKVTPGSCLPIVPEKGFEFERGDTLLVLPWHFKSFLLDKFFEKNKGVSLLFPMPEIEIVSR